MVVATGLVVGGIVAGIGAVATGSLQAKFSMDLAKGIDKTTELNSNVLMTNAREQAAFVGRQTDSLNQVVSQQAGAAGFSGGTFDAVQADARRLAIEQQELIIAGAKRQDDLLRRRGKNQKKAAKQQAIMSIVGALTGGGASAVQGAAAGGLF